MPEHLIPTPEEQSTMDKLDLMPIAMDLFNVDPNNEEQKALLMDFLLSSKRELKDDPRGRLKAFLCVLEACIKCVKTGETLKFGTYLLELLDKSNVIP